MARLLAVGDIHLGRKTAVTSLGRAQVPADSISVAAAWKRTVSEAVRLQVDAVLLAGDVVDNDAALPEAISPLEVGVADLAAAGIRVIAVAGNHDTQALVRVKKLVPALTLLGQAGVWEEALVEARDGAHVRILGRSFVQSTSRGNPLTGLPGELKAGLIGGTPVIGLLHCDTQQPSSVYAPVSLAELAQVPVRAWLLGHIHKPSISAGDATPIGYLGSLQGLDPTETGIHGPWLLEVDAAGVRTMEQIAVAGLAWDTLEVDVTGCADGAGLTDRVLADLNPALDTHPSAELVGVRVSLVGRLKEPRLLAEVLAGAQVLARETGNRRVFVDAIRWDRVVPDHDLEELAKHSDAPGVVAGLLKELDYDNLLSEETANLVKEMTALVTFQRDRTDLLKGGDARTLAIELLREAGIDILDRIPMGGGAQ